MMTWSRTPRELTHWPSRAIGAAVDVGGVEHVAAALKVVVEDEHGFSRQSAEKSAPMHSRDTGLRDAGNPGRIAWHCRGRTASGRLRSGAD